MLKDLKILNGEMPLEFNSMNTSYTINVQNKETELKYSYNIDKNDNISIFGNNLKDGLNEVVITVYNDKEQMSYYLDVYKEPTVTASVLENNYDDLKVKTEPEIYVAPTIGVICFIFILLFFTLLFRKN